ncbi:MAG: hypothetical protein ACHREM_21700, partial [Polyangiales bacterium]
MSRAWRVWVCGLLACVLSCASRGDGEPQRNALDASIAESNAATHGSAIDDASIAVTSAGVADPLTLTADGNGAFVARHAWHRFATKIDSSGATLSGPGNAWSAGLHLARIGREGVMRDVDRPAPAARSRRIELTHEGVTEWYVHDSRGLEQGFDVATRPGGEGRAAASNLPISP